jgi:predicted Zn-dependent protease
MLELAATDIESNRLAAAASRTKRAIEIEPKNPQAHHLLGRVLLATEHFLESARELETAKLLAPDSALIRSHLAMVYQKLGRRKEAELEAAAFISLKNKEGIFAPPEEKTKVDAQPGRPQR